MCALTELLLSVESSLALAETSLSAEPLLVVELLLSVESSLALAETSLSAEPLLVVELLLFVESSLALAKTSLSAESLLVVELLWLTESSVLAVLVDSLLFDVFSLVLVLSEFLRLIALLLATVLLLSALTVYVLSLNPTPKAITVTAAKTHFLPSLYIL